MSCASSISSSPAWVVAFLIPNRFGSVMYLQKGTLAGRVSRFSAPLGANRLAPAQLLASTTRPEPALTLALNTKAQRSRRKTRQEPEKTKRRHCCGALGAAEDRSRTAAAATAFLLSSRLGVERTP